MAITSLDGVIAGAQMPQFYIKNFSGALVAGRPFTPFYTAGIPGAAIAPTPGIAGAALTSYPGQLPFTNPGSGNSYLARFVGMSTAQLGTMVLFDRLWHNSGISVTTFPGAQTVNSVAFPARDNNGTSDGDGVLLALEVSSTTGTGTPTITVTYTNSMGVGGKTGTNIITTNNSSPTGTFYPISLAAGDKGVRSVQSVALSASWTSGTVHLVAYRPIAYVQCPAAGVAVAVDALTSGMPELFDGTVPFIYFVPQTTTTTVLQGSFTVTQG